MRGNRWRRHGIKATRDRIAYLENALPTCTSDHRRQLLENLLVQSKAELAGHCIDCGRELETPESVARGIGPECWAKRQAVAS